MDDGALPSVLRTDDIAAFRGAQAAQVRLVRDVHDTPWGTKELVIKDNQGHTLYFGQSQ